MLKAEGEPAWVERGWEPAASVSIRVGEEKLQGQEGGITRETPGPGRRDFNPKAHWPWPLPFHKQQFIRVRLLNIIKSDSVVNERLRCIC